MGAYDNGLNPDWSDEMESYFHSWLYWPTPTHCEIRLGTRSALARDMSRRFPYRPITANSIHSKIRRLRKAAQCKPTKLSTNLRSPQPSPIPHSSPTPTSNTPGTRRR